MHRAAVECLLPRPAVAELVRAWLAEDCPSLDYAAQAVGDAAVRATIRCKEDRAAVLAGAPFADEVFRALGCEVQWLHTEGARIGKGQVAAVTGPACRVLQGERLALNILARASGVATIARACVEIARGRVGIAGTRKTTPGFRVVEKYALAVGGAQPHRYDACQMIMLKDNHVDIAGSINAAVRSVHAGRPFCKLEVECEDAEEAIEALACGADIVMLDNVPIANLRRDVAQIRASYPSACLEVSGGVTMDNLCQYCDIPGIDIVSMGCLTSGYPTVDFSMRIASDE